MTTPEQYATLHRQYPNIDAIDDNFELERDMSGELLTLDYDCGTITPEIKAADAERRLITMIDAEGRHVAFVVGLSLVNRLAYYCTVNPMPQALYDSRLCVADV